MPSENQEKRYGMNHIVQCTEEWEKTDLQVRQHELGGALRALIDAVRWIDIADPRAAQVQTQLDRLFEIVESSVDKIQDPTQEDLIFGNFTEDRLRQYAGNELIRGPASYLHFPTKVLSRKIDIENRDCSIKGTIKFPKSAQGWPGIAHGGMIAASFDILMPSLMRHLSDLTSATDSREEPKQHFTANLSVDYCANTPIEKDLDYVVWLEKFEEPRKIFLKCEISDQGKVTAKGTSLWVIVK